MRSIVHHICYRCTDKCVAWVFDLEWQFDIAIFIATTTCISHIVFYYTTAPTPQLMPPFLALQLQTQCRRTLILKSSASHSPIVFITIVVNVIIKSHYFIWLYNFSVFPIAQSAKHIYCCSRHTIRIIRQNVITDNFHISKTLH